MNLGKAKSIHDVQTKPTKNALLTYYSQMSQLIIPRLVSDRVLRRAGVPTFGHPFALLNVDFAITPLVYFRLRNVVWHPVMGRRFGETMVIGYECARAKPHPEPYLEGLSRLGLPADACVAFEDSVNGVSSAVAAGLYTVGVGESSEKKLHTVGAGLCVEDYLDSRLCSTLGLAVNTE